MGGFGEWRDEKSDGRGWGGRASGGSIDGKPDSVFRLRIDGECRVRCLVSRYIRKVITASLPTANTH